MSLSELIAGVEAHEKTLTVYDAAPGAVDAVRERFADRNVTVETGTADGPDSFAVLHEDGEFLTAVDLSALIDPEGDGAGLAEAPYRKVLDHLDETMFTSYAPDRMLAASEEIEDRAWRVGRGELHAGFQRTANFADRVETYERLAGRSDLSVHAYAAPDGSSPETDAVRLHVEDTAELRESWFVVFDGDGVDTNKCALVAEEREPRAFYGFWTYDPDTVDYVIDHLHATYNVATADGGEQSD